MHIGQTNPAFSDPPLEAVDVRQIYDKFPEKKGGLKELYEKGPPNAFFLVKFWVSCPCPSVPDGPCQEHSAPWARPCPLCLGLWVPCRRWVPGQDASLGLGQHLMPPGPLLQADLNSTIQEGPGAFYGVSSQYSSADSMTISVSTKVCSFGKQVVEKVEVSGGPQRGRGPGDGLLGVGRPSDSCPPPTPSGSRRLSMPGWRMGALCTASTAHPCVST